MVLAAQAQSVVALVIQEVRLFVSKAEENMCSMASLAGELEPAVPVVTNTLCSHVSANLNPGSENTLDKNQ